MKMITKILGVVIMAISLFGCSAKINEYKGQEPKLNLQQFLQGRIEGTGLIQNWKDKATRDFDFYGDASWDGNEGTFDEHMTYSDGQKDHRIWKITKISDNYYEGRTDDVIGVAKIYVQGNAMNWQYEMNIPVEDKTYKISFDDWMYLTNDGTLINKNTFSKFGIKVGSLTLFMRKVGE